MRNLAVDVFSSLFKEETITSLMSQLDDKQNWNLFYIVNFLNSYYSSNAANSQKNYQDIMILYGEIIKEIKNKGEGYKHDLDEYKKSHQQLEFKDSDKIPNHTHIIDKFNGLKNYEQQNLKYLASYILWCKIELDISNPHRTYPLWQRYSQLIEDIKSLPIPINENI